MKLTNFFGFLLPKKISTEINCKIFGFMKPKELIVTFKTNIFIVRSI